MIFWLKTKGDSFYEVHMSLPCFQNGVKLAEHTTFRIGGTARAFCIARSAEEVVEAAWKAESMGMAWYVIGRGSNILASDSGLGNAIIAFKDDHLPVINPDGTVTVSGGLGLWELANFCATNGLSGLENLAGIPGTVGGAIAGNAGAYGTSMGELVRSALLLDKNGNIQKNETREITFTYRGSSIRDGGKVVLEATLALWRRDVHEIESTMAKRLMDRRNKHPDPAKVSTAGSYFKNPELKDGTRVAAGKLLEQAGCKELRIGNAHTWPTHANIIVTDGASSAAEVLELTRRMTERVSQIHGIRLVPEVVYLE